MKRALLGAFATRWDRIALVSILIGVMIRGVWILMIHPPVDFVYPDMELYVTRAERR